MDKIYTAIEHRLHQFATLPALPAPKRDRHGLAMVCIAKNEERYLPEWIAFHRLVGARHFYIYVNDRVDAACHAVKRFIEDGLVTVIPWDNYTTVASPQTLAYAHALANFGPYYRWMAFIDVDEFLFPVSHATLLEALDQFQDLSGLAVPWHLFGTSGHAVPPPGLVTEHYQMRAPFPPRAIDYQMLQYKSVVDPAAVLSMKNSHWFYLPDGTRAAFTEGRHKLNMVSEHLPSLAQSRVFRLNHYFTRSASEIVAKMHGGRADRPGAPRGTRGKFIRTKRIWQLIERAPVHDTLIQRFLPDLKQALVPHEATVHAHRSMARRAETLTPLRVSG
ncbi:MAG: glycosyltransferase family 92 protein [Pseudomonadota bacterium]